MGNHHCVDPTSDKAMYLYCASTPAAIAFAVLYGITFFAHIWQAIMYKKAFCWVVCMAAGWEFAGLVTRVISTFNQTSLAVGFPSQLLILLAPLWINAFCYMVLARMVWFYREDGKVFGVKAPRVGMIFVLCDIFSFLVQGAGGVMIQPDASPSTIKLGFDVYRIGLGVQEAFILIFLGLAIRFQLMVKRQDDAGLGGRGDLEKLRLREDRPGEWKPLLYTIYAALIIITVRVIYRIIEFSSGIYGYLPEHEWVYYAFDGFLMWLVLVLFNVIHPGRYLVGENASWPKKSRKEKKAEKKARKEAKALEKAERKAGKAGTAPGPYEFAPLSATEEHRERLEDADPSIAERQEVFDSTDSLNHGRFVGADHAGTNGYESTADFGYPRYGRAG